MKFSITFKYSNVTFKNKETKETVTYDSKAEGNTFTFDNVDEDVVLGIVKGIKDRKASQVFAYDNLRTNFVNVIARNKCKELYDKLDKGGWKVEDVSISTATIKDLEFTKPTMNARENLTVESRNKKTDISGIVCINWEWSSEYGDTESGEERIPVFGTTDETIKKAVLKFCNKKTEWAEVGGHCDNVYIEVFLTDYDTNEKEFLFDGSFENGEIKWFDNNGKGEHKYTEEAHMEGRKVNEDFKDTMRKENQKDLSDLIDVVTKAIKEIDIISNMYDVSDTSFEKLQDVRTMLLNALPSTKTAKKMGWCNESKEEVKVEFKKTPEDGEVIAFFPDTAKDGSCNPGMIMSYMHVGQHGEASVEFYNDCTTCLEEDYADLLAELEKVYDDCELVVVD